MDGPGFVIPGLDWFMLLPLAWSRFNHGLEWSVRWQFWKRSWGCKLGKPYTPDHLFLIILEQFYITELPCGSLLSVTPFLDWPLLQVGSGSDHVHLRNLQPTAPPSPQSKRIVRDDFTCTFFCTMGTKKNTQTHPCLSSLLHLLKDDTCLWITHLWLLLCIDVCCCITNDYTLKSSRNKVNNQLFSFKECWNAYFVDRLTILANWKQRALHWLYRGKYETSK